MRDGPREVQPKTYLMSENSFCPGTQFKWLLKFMRYEKRKDNVWKFGENQQRRKLELVNNLPLWSSIQSDSFTKNIFILQ